MAFPDGVVTTTLTVSPGFTATGSAVTVKVAVKPSQQVTHKDSGEPLLPFEITTDYGDEDITLTVPSDDQPGFVDQAGADITFWGYVVTVSRMDKTAQTSTIERTIHLPAGPDVDFDLIPAGVSLPPVVGDAPFVTSVNGMRGDVTLESLEGPEGPEGPPGADGLPGIDGAPGLPGADGVDGIQGPPGVDGNDGAPGTDGAPGAPGVDGLQGIPGTDGADGLPGAPGTPGTDGAPGADGLQGLPGVDGADGLQGLPGIDGTDGAPGTPGTNGTNGTDGVDGADGAPGAVGVLVMRYTGGAYPALPATKPVGVYIVDAIGPESPGGLPAWVGLEAAQIPLRYSYAPTV